ncbi:MAG: ThiF family adenylyltransferase [Acidobacteriia bacterium]|nr:ThiF family adenylyltransferase [Terriglobia bacterium]
MRQPPMDRYSRQVRFSPLGENGQRQLEGARLAIVGCGALGSFQAASLARAGVGYLRLIDRDYVELNNLQRQWLYDESDAEQALPKAVAAAQQLARLNSSILVEPHVSDLTAANALDLLMDVDLILDGTDNFETRYLINEFAVRESVPWIYGAAVSSYGLVMPVIPGETACFSCLYPEPPSGVQPTCETAGVLNTITAAIGALQSSMALQILSGHPDLVPRRITTVDVWTGHIRQLEQPPRQPDCTVCGMRRFPLLDGSCRAAPISLCGRNAVQIHLNTNTIDLAQLAERLAPLGKVRANEFALRFQVDAYELTVFPDGRAIIKGTTDTGLARSLYARYIGA